MPFPDLTQLAIGDPEMRRVIGAKQPAAAAKIAARRFSAGLADVALAEWACGRSDSAVRKLGDALNACPDNRDAFHNLVALLMDQRQFRGENYAMLTKFVGLHLGKLPWIDDYRRLLYMPRFLNLEFVAGLCNLHCRMCTGRNAPTYPGKLRYLAAENFERMCLAAPTIKGVTLSSGDSDPLMHAQLDEIIAIARRHQIRFSIYTNAVALTPKRGRAILESGVANMINFSIDAAGAETYRRIRGGDFERVIERVEAFRRMQVEGSHPAPWISFSFVAMQDNIQELPDYVDLAVRNGGRRVYVEDLIGWGPRGSDGNVPATEHPDWRCFVEAARERANSAGIQLELPEGLRATPSTANQTTASESAEGESDRAAAAEVCEPPELVDAARYDDANADVAPSVGDAARHVCCTWLQGVWVCHDGTLEPCCLVQRVADMGNVGDGPLLHNDKYARVKELLMAGKVFEPCLTQRQCAYVQQQHAAGTPLDLMTKEDLGDLWLDPVPNHTEAAVVQELPVVV